MKQTILKIAAALIGMNAVVIAAAIYIPGHSSRSVIKHYYEQEEDSVDYDECLSYNEIQSSGDGHYGVRLNEDWIIQPKYEIIRETTDGYLCKKGNKYEFIYNSGDSLNAFVIDEIEHLYLSESESGENAVSDFLLYNVDGKCGLIRLQEDGNLVLLTEPLYEDIKIITPTILKVTISHSPETGWIYAIMNREGELINL